VFIGRYVPFGRNRAENAIACGCHPVSLVVEQRIASRGAQAVVDGLAEEARAPSTNAIGVRAEFCSAPRGPTTSLS
jgi:hypothetical protein